ncbi:MAG TPA: hypothetical protein VMT22_22245 [Terriglobales bacterium]|jgi:hypothetical protein|nr:hypothetical protein [Terriglobales bacterium]
MVPPTSAISNSRRFSAPFETELLWRYGCSAWPHGPAAIVSRIKDSIFERGRKKQANRQSKNFSKIKKKQLVTRRIYLKENDHQPQEINFHGQVA